MSILVFLLCLGFIMVEPNTRPAEINPVGEDIIIGYTVDPKDQKLSFHWKDPSGKHYGNFERLKTELAKQDKELNFAMNGGMYKSDQSPQGLYIENGKTLSALDTASKGYGNFYLQPNGVFYLTEKHQPIVCTTRRFQSGSHIAYATQSGPMLLIDGKVHPKFRKGSSNVHIRNGVGILPDGRIHFAISTEKVNFYDFAVYFQTLGCENALYLDGFVSRAFIPSEGWAQMDGGFGVIIAETK
ncbi:MAG: phosphodiester glycosidase family protein [Bacteroidota bacterium]